MVNAYRIAIAVIGTFVVVAAAAISMAYAMFVAFPFAFVLGYIALWRISRSRSVYVPIGVAIAGTLGLIGPSIVYIRNAGNWNQPGTQGLLLPLVAGIVLLGTNVFAIYLRDLTSRLATLVGGPALLIACSVGFWWLLHVDSSRADLYMYRLLALVVCVYTLLGMILGADAWARSRRQHDRMKTGSSR